MSSVSKMSSNNKRGRAYQCLRCLHRTGKEMVDARYRVENHILKQHLGLDEVPHYCSLCLFRCQKRQELEDHVRTYKRHTILAEEKGVTDHAACLISNPSPYILGERDILTLTQEESLAHWAKRQRRSDFLEQAVQQVFPEGLMAEMEAPVTTHLGRSPAPTVKIPGYQAATPGTVGGAPSPNRTTASQLQGNLMQPTGTSTLMAEVSKLVGGTVLKTFLGLTSPEAASNGVVPEEPARQTIATPMATNPCNSVPTTPRVGTPLITRPKEADPAPI